MAGLSFARLGGCRPGRAGQEPEAAWQRTLRSGARRATPRRFHSGTEPLGSTPWRRRDVWIHDPIRCLMGARQHPRYSPYALVITTLTVSTTVILVLGIRKIAQFPRWGDVPISLTWGVPFSHRLVPSPYRPNGVPCSGHNRGSARSESPEAAVPPCPAGHIMGLVVSQWPRAWHHPPGPLPWGPLNNLAGLQAAQCGSLP